jgi:hypothetical protein
VEELAYKMKEKQKMVIVYFCLNLLCNDDVGEWWCGWNGDRLNGFAGPCKNGGGGWGK